MKWEPIETLPPNNTQEVLFYRKIKNSKQPKIVIGRWVESEYCYCVQLTTKEVKDATHWMLLPNEPEGN